MMCLIQVIREYGSEGELKMCVLVIWKSRRTECGFQLKATKAVLKSGVGTHTVAPVSTTVGLTTVLG